MLGPLIALTGLVREAWMLYVTLAAASISLTWLVVYSYLVYRADPDRITPAGTSPSSE